MMRAPCSNCSFPVEVSAEDIRQVLDDMVLIRHRKLAAPETAAARLSLCFRCDMLGPGATCRHSGGLVEVKAKLEGERCPYPNQPKW